MFIEINNLEFMQKTLIILGTVCYDVSPDNLTDFCIKCNENKLLPQLFYRVKSTPKKIKYRFQYTIILENCKTIYQIYFYDYQNGKEEICSIDNFHYFCPISMKYSNSYFASDNWLLTYDNDHISVIPKTSYRHLVFELHFCKQLMQDKRYGDIFTRQLVALIKVFHRKKIWLLYDRIYRADDNGEAFFEYLQNHPDQNIQPYYLIDKHCQDYKRLKKIGRVIPFFSFREKILFLLCQYKISSQADHYTTYPMGEDNYSFQDLLHKSKFIFLQHGVIKDDLSNWLNYYNRKIWGFITSAEDEANSILSLQYEYNKEQIWLTGLPRFDKLYHNEQNIITIMPTWRKYLMDNKYTIQGTRKLKPCFEQSDFYKAYDSLLSNPVLKQFLRNHGYLLYFMPHPMMEPYIDQFPQYEHVHFFSSKDRYQDIYAMSNLVVTDYSSAVFDFALLKKPIIYFQFDFDKFFSGAHTFKQGYFNYEGMAFGEIFTDVEQVVRSIIQYINNNCQMPLLYQERVNNFFKYIDQNNCERVYARIKSFEDSLADNMELSIKVHCNTRKNVSIVFLHVYIVPARNHILKL